MHNKEHPHCNHLNETSFLLRMHNNTRCCIIIWFNLCFFSDVCETEQVLNPNQQWVLRFKHVLCQTSGFCVQIALMSANMGLQWLTYLSHMRKAWVWWAVCSPRVLPAPNEIHDKSRFKRPANMLGNGMLDSTYLSPLKTQVISHNVKTIKSKNIAWW